MTIPLGSHRWGSRTQPPAFIGLSIRRPLDKAAVPTTALLFGLLIHTTALSIESVSSAVPKHTIECEVKDVQVVEWKTGVLVPSSSKHWYSGRTFLVDPQTGRIMSRTGLFEYSDRTHTVIDDGQSPGQWLKVVYTEVLPSRSNKKANMSYLVVKRPVQELLFTMSDAVLIYSGVCR